MTDSGHTPAKPAGEHETGEDDQASKPKRPAVPDPSSFEATMRMIPAQPAPTVTPPPSTIPPSPDPMAIDQTMRLPVHPPVHPPPASHIPSDVEATMKLPTRMPAATPPPPAWAPPTPPASPSQPVSAAPPPPAPPAAVDATMRMIPIPRIPTAEAPPAPTPAVPPGERRIGKYIVKRELGRGGMGAVYLAEQPGLGREVAIKELIQSAIADPVAMKRFMQEAQVMARASHPNLVQVHDLEQIGDANYIVLEFVRGRSLRDWINQGRMALPQVFAVMHGVLQGLDYAHKRQIVHRDMKPENVLMSDEGDVKVADFGIARLADDSGVGGTATKTGTTVGTPQYMSPEQVASSKVDGRSDLYSTGIVFYELVVGQPPFIASEADGPFTLMAKHVQAPPQPPSVRVPGLDPALEEVILKSLSKRPEDRYQTGQDFDDAVTRVADRLCPGWQRALQPGADLSKMVPGLAPAPAFAYAPAAPGMQPMAQLPIQAVYNPTPPVKPASKKASSGCLGIIAGALAIVPILTALLLGLLR
jgi:serine/threonine protein kinase